jgi:AbiU2
LNESNELIELRQLVQLFNDKVLNLKFRFSIWESMNNQKLIDRHNKKLRGHVYGYIKNSLLICCFLDIANLGKDEHSDFKLLSLIDIKKLISNISVKNELLTQLQNKKISIDFIGATPPDNIVNELTSKRRAEYIAYFNSSLMALNKKFKDSKFNHNLKKIWNIRSKIAAHNELAVENGQINIFDISVYELKWEDISLLIKDLEEITKLLFAVVENSDMTYSSFDNDIEASISNFWKPILNNLLATPSA